MSADPHAFRGAHQTEGGVVIRTVRPAAKTVTVYVKNKPVAELEPADTDGLFEGAVPKAKLPLAYQLEVDYGEGGTFRIEDPYRFPPTVGELDLHLAAEGRHEEIYARLGAHVIEHEGVRGTAFAVWAPAAQSV
jgi:1,4-alpha-glucan branching enzyme